MGTSTSSSSEKLKYVSMFGGLFVSYAIAFAAIYETTTSKEAMQNAGVEERVSSVSAIPLEKLVYTSVAKGVQKVAARCAEADGFFCAEIDLWYP